MQLEALRDEIDMIHGPPLKVIADCMRGYITAKPGNKLIAADFSSIEARVLAWLASEEGLLNIFRGHGKVYEHTASKIFGVPFDKVTFKQRLIGKVAILALGFQGGVRAFQSMAKVYFVKVPDAQADEIKIAWRQEHPNIVNYWFRLEDAAIAAAKHPGESYHVGERGRHITYLRKGSFLMCRLPSGRVIMYPYPRMDMVRTPWGQPKLALTYKGEKDRRFQRTTAYGGLLAENITQAVARDLLRDAMFRWEASGYPIIMHVHDELVSEVKKNSGKNIAEATKLLCEVPKWAVGLPIQADGWEGKRYRK
jgi:DNA polymerase